MERLLTCLCVLILSCSVPTAAANDQRPAIISLIIDDIGNRLHNDKRAAALPGPLAYAVLPHTPHARQIAELAHSLDKDILVHLPMEAKRGNHMLGPGALLVDMPEDEFKRTLISGIEAVPHAIGISNHMGSLLTSNADSMARVMRTLRSLGLFYLDSRTSHLTVAGDKAERYQVSYLHRDVFLDNEPDRDYVMAQFEQLIDTARRQGSAIGIGHPHSVTLDVLYEMLPRLNHRGVELVSLREMLAHRSRRNESW